MYLQELSEASQQARVELSLAALREEMWWPFLQAKVCCVG